MEIRQIIGACMLVLYIVGMLAFTIYTYGLKEALIGWGIALIATAFVFVGAYLLVS